MTDYTPNPQITVGESAVPSQIMALARDGLLGVTAWAVGKGYIDQYTGSQIVMIGLGVFVVVWRQFVTRTTHQKLVMAAEAAPSATAVVVR